MRRGADEKGRDGNDEEKGGSPRHSTLEVAPENPPDATHFLKENANGLANKLRGPSLPPASKVEAQERLLRATLVTEARIPPGS